jgi:hypothetical protein
MSWYKTVKSINSRQYYYWQRTYRLGKQVKTENKYIGPVSGSRTSPAAPSTYSTSAPRTPEDVMKHFTPKPAAHIPDPIHPMDQALTGRMKILANALQRKTTPMQLALGILTGKKPRKSGIPAKRIIKDFANLPGQMVTGISSAKKSVTRWFLNILEK